jgi:hypothetical protein
MMDAVKGYLSLRRKAGFDMSNAGYLLASFARLAAAATLWLPGPSAPVCPQSTPRGRSHPTGFGSSALTDDGAK